MPKEKVYLIRCTFLLTMYNSHNKGLFLKKISLVLVLLLQYATASETVAQYDIDFSVFGTIAKVSMSKVIEESNYVITVRADTIGPVSALTKDRRDTYISQGSIANSQFIPDVLVVKRKTYDKEKYTVYKFNHIKKIVQKESAEVKHVRSQSMDIRHMRIVYTEKVEFSSSSSQNDYYAKNDIVSLIFNSPTYIDSLKRDKYKLFYAVGIKTDEGVLRLTQATNKANKNYLPGSIVPKINAFDITLKKEFFNKGKGTLAIRLDADGFPSQAVMNDVAFYGDIVGNRVYTKVVSK